LIKTVKNGRSIMMKKIMKREGKRAQADLTILLPIKI
jgi:hypothetical protein